MAGRPRRPIWKRPYSSFRQGERARSDVDGEPIRLTLYLPGRLLDLAETFATRDGVATVQIFCEELLTRALEDERGRHRIEDAEARRGPFEGLNEIADDPEYLAEWTASHAGVAASRASDASQPPVSDEPSFVDFALVARGPLILSAPIEVEGAETILRHAGLSGDDPEGFLARLRRGEAPGFDAVEELGSALVAVDRAMGGPGGSSPMAIDRRLAHALHRLAIESQVLQTDAWPGAFDNWTVDAIRAVQAAVDRILSGNSGTA